MTPDCPLSAGDLAGGEGAAHAPPPARAHPPARTPAAPLTQLRARGPRGGCKQPRGRPAVSSSVTLALGVQKLQRRGSLTQAGKPRPRAGRALPSVSLTAPAGPRQGTPQLSAERRDRARPCSHLGLPGGRRPWAQGQVQVSQVQPPTGRRDFRYRWMGPPRPHASRGRVSTLTWEPGHAHTCSSCRPIPRGSGTERTAPSTRAAGCGQPPSTVPRPQDVHPHNCERRGGPQGAHALVPRHTKRVDTGTGFRVTDT